jgi:hypothetical protein
MLLCRDEFADAPMNQLLARPRKLVRCVSS